MSTDKSEKQSWTKNAGYECDNIYVKYESSIEAMSDNVTTWLLRDANLGRFFLLISKGSGSQK